MCYLQRIWSLLEQRTSPSLIAARRASRLSKCHVFSGVRALLLGALLILPAALRADTIPAKTTLEIRIEQPISSYSTRPNTKIDAVLIAPLDHGRRIVVPLGTTLHGTVVQVRSVGLGFVHETARMELRFDRLTLADGRTVPIQCRLTAIENARESIDKQGRIQGIRSTSTLSSRASGVVGALSFGDPIAAIFTTAGSASVLRFSEPEISFPAGTEFLAELTAPLHLPDTPVTTVPPMVHSPQQRQALAAMVHSLPFRTYTTGKKVLPSDMTNLIFIGSADALQRAFAASGWVVVDQLTAATTYSTVRSIAENQGYKSAPMSTLVLADRPPDYAYAKTLNTFSKRHHLRIWNTGKTWQGQPVWTSSSTHDIGIGFSKKDKTFIHLIDTNIDNERAKVVNDMIYTGCVTGAQLVARPWLPKDAKNGTGEDLVTDGRIAVIRLDDCRDPVDDTGNQAVPELRVHGNELDRATRQTVLTLRNTLIRDNVGVSAYSGIRYAVDAKKKPSHSAAPRNMDVEGEKYTIDPGFRPADAYTQDPASESSSVSTLNVRHNSTNPWAPPSVEFGIHGGFLGYYGGNGGAIGYLFTQSDPPESTVTVVLSNELHNGWDIGGTVTLDPQKYLSHEFSYDYSLTGFRISLGVVQQDHTSGSEQNAFAFNDVGLRTSQIAYNLLINARPRTSRLRPYLAVGPALQLMHLDDAPITKAPGWYRLGLSNIGLLTAAYNFGSTPPLEGGGIFQPGLNYGGGLRYRLTPRWMLRADFRETLTSQPDFWTKSKDDILANIDITDGSLLSVVGPVLAGPLRQDRITGGMSFTF